MSSHDEMIGNYRILGELGRGGMGVVYKAEQVALNRFVALKVLYPHLCGEPVTVMRFNREARTTALLNHPNIVQIYDVGQHEDMHYFAMEYVPGKTLSQVLATRGNLPLQEIIRIADQVAAALGAAHDVGLIHRDVKPSNIIVDDHGRVKVTDFGIALAAGQGDLTDTGHLVGTARYMSPEHARGDDIDPRSDLYSLGVVMFEMLTGHVPFDDDSPLTVLEMHVEQPPPDLRAVVPGTPAGLVQVVERLLAKAPADRFRTARDLRHALREAAAQVQWTGAGLPPLEPVGEQLEVDPAFAFDAAGPLHQVTDSVTLFLLDRLPAGKPWWGRLREGLEDFAVRRFGHRRDSYKLQKLEVARLHEQLRNAERQLERAKGECDRIYKKWEVTDESLHDWQMHGSLAIHKFDALTAEEAANEESHHWKRATSYKLQWRSIQEQVRDWYTNVERARQEYERARKDLTRLRDQRRRSARTSGVTLRNRLHVGVTLVLVLVGTGWLAMHFRGAGHDTPAVPPSPDFVKVGLLNSARDESDAVLLPDGRVLVAGGLGENRLPLDTAELYDPRTRTFTPTGNLNVARYNHTLELLRGGNVLVIGGASRLAGEREVLDSLEEYHVTDGRFAQVSTLRRARNRHRSVTLPDGRILVTGGRDSDGDDIALIEVFDPETNRCSEAGNLLTARKDHTLTALAEGTVLIVGGSMGSGTPLDSIERYDPADRKSRPIGRLLTARYEHTATLLADGRVLIIGGRKGQHYRSALTEVEVIDPRDGSSEALSPLPEPRKVHSATLVTLGGHKGVLVVGGGTVSEAQVSRFFDFTLEKFLPGAKLNYRRNNHLTLTLRDGSVLVLGGWGDDARTPLRTAELYVPAP